MCDEWMPTLRLPMTEAHFRQLPRNRAYRYEYVNGEAVLTPNSRHFHGLLDLAAAETVLRAEERLAEWRLRPIRPAEVPELAPLFATTFQSTQPFGSLDDATRLEAARRTLGRTRAGGDGPWIEPASFVALEREPAPEVYRGAIFITLLPAGDPTDWDSYYWREPPPLDAVAERLGRPHLTWVFVEPGTAGHGLGTTLLAAAVRALRALGYTELASTFMVGNDSSLLWHWRTGFRLLPYPGSRRQRKE